MMSSGDAVPRGLVKVGKPNRVPYINFTQDFRQKYKGESRNAKEMIVLTAQAWRNLSEVEKAPYVEIAEQEKLKPRPAIRKSQRLEKLQNKVNKLKVVVRDLQGRMKYLQTRRLAALMKSKPRTSGRGQLSKTTRVVRKTKQAVNKQSRRQATRKPTRKTTHRAALCYSSESMDYSSSSYSS